jgi:hypothetical protein
MRSSPWYSAAVRLCVVIDSAELVDQVRSVLVFRADGFDEAFSKALSLGKELERTFTNGDGQEVQWLLAAVETLDELDDDISDGREVYSEPLGPGDGSLPRIAPDESVPTQSGV